MKTIVRVALLLLLAATIVFGTAWYLLEYDTDFTHDALLFGAQYFEEKGQPAISTWLYDMAYQYGQSIEQIALELAEYYESIGNYAKVESTLKRAIEDGAGVDIYIALSKAFIAQDKLLDAYTLLENVQDPSIRSKLDLLRPATPQPDIAPDHYNEYISVSFLSEGSRVYVVNSAQVPSVQSHLHTAPIELGTGEAIFWAMAVSDSGLVSPIYSCRYVIKGVVEPVVFTNEKMEETIRGMVSIPYGVTVYTNDLWDIHSFEVPKGVEDISDLKYLPYLTSLTIANSNASLTPICTLTNLTALSIENTTVDAETLQAILAMTEMKTLTLRNCGIISLNGFENLTKLTHLDLSQNILTDITPLASLVDLEVLSINNSAVVDLTALGNLTALQELQLSFNSIENVTALSTLTGLKILNLSNNLITNIRAIGKLTALTNLDLSYNKISTASYLSSCVALKELVISNNKISNITSFSSLVNVEKLDVSNNAITKLPTLSKNCALSTLNASYNKITSITPVAGLKFLNTINLDYNPSLSKITDLSNCPKLVSVSVYGTKVKNVTALTDLNVIVYYDPT